MILVFLRLEAQVLEVRKKKYRIEYDVAEVGEEDDTQIWNAPKTKKTLAPKNIYNTQKPKNGISQIKL